MAQLWGMKASGSSTAVPSPTRKFYLAGLSYFGSLGTQGMHPDMVME